MIAGVAEYAEILRESYWAEENTFAAVREFLSPVQTTFADNADVAEFFSLLDRAILITTAEVSR